MFKKALALPPGTPGSVPPDVVQKHKELQQKTPKLRAAVINSIIPRDAGYSTMLEGATASLNTFRSWFKEKAFVQEAVGYTYLEIKAILHSDDAVKDAQDRGDLKEADGWTYLKRQAFRETETHRKGFEKEDTHVNTDGSLDNILEELHLENWATFAVRGDRKQALEAGHDEERTKPPSEESRLHLSEPYDKMERLIISIRKACRYLATLSLTNGSVSNTFQDGCEKALIECAQLEGTLFQRFHKMMVQDMKSTTDAMIKKLLRSACLPYKRLDEMAKNLAALVKANKAVEKGSGKKNLK